MDDVTLLCSGPWMTVRLARPHRCLSWAVVNGASAVSDVIAWRFLERDEIRDIADPAAWLREELSRAGMPGAVGLLTSRRRHQYVDAGAGSPCRAIATVGLSNALRAGDPAVSLAATGTINLACIVNARLTEEAVLEALALASEARAAAMLSAAVPSIVSGKPASGAGTDCIVIAHPLDGEAERYCGKHTALGAAIGAGVEEAIARGVAEWLAEMRP